LDIGRCFDSIYTHSLPWALLGKRAVKESRREAEGTIGGRFDRLMCRMNYAETNGIILGPEFSRIFAELILQSIDRDVYRKLLSENLVHMKDYEAFRYIDDYFIFYNNEKVKNAFLPALQFKLKDYKMSLNAGKEDSYERPIVTGITMAKHRIRKLLMGEFAFTGGETHQNSVSAAQGEKNIGRKKEFISIDSRSLIIQFKTILKECGVRYGDILNNALSIVEERSLRIIKGYNSIAKVKGSEEQLVKAIQEICEFTFFIYSVSPRVSTTIKLCRVLRVFISYLKKKGAGVDLRHSVFKLIFDNILFTMRGNKSFPETQVETLYLLIVLTELGSDYRVDESLLCTYFEIDESSFGPRPTLNYLSLVVLLFYIKRKKRYDRLRKCLEETIKEKLHAKKASLHKETELVLLSLDSIACPYIEAATKKDILAMYGVEDEAIQDAVIKKRQYWFTKWTDFDFGKELDVKGSFEVY
jgi:hypothetical protein